jgi:hypothetical protein
MGNLPPWDPAKQPSVLYPETIGQPKKLMLEKKNVLTIYYKNKVDAWNLAN